MTEEVPTFVVVNITTSRRGLELIDQALEHYWRTLSDDGTSEEVLDEITDILDGLKGA